MGQPKKICLITPGHIASNPRLVKEAIALDGYGYAVHIVFTQYLCYLQKQDQAILKANPSWTFSIVDWTGSNFISRARRVFSGAVQRISTILSLLFPTSFVCLLVTNRFFFSQLRQAVNAKANLYIAHNLGALPVSVVAAKRNRAKAGFDAEDFHRLETTDDENSKSYKTTVTIENRFLSRVHHFTAASPLIKGAYQELYPNLKNAVSILNVFPKTEGKFTVLKKQGTQPLRLFWFSQTVGKNRGIEEIIEAIKLSSCTGIELHLLGQCSDEMKEYFAGLANASDVSANSLYFHVPVSEKELFRLASQYDIGLAGETGIPYNRDICLTNKIFTYIQAGLAVLASDTSAQLRLFKSYPGIGAIYKKKNAGSLAEAIIEFSNYRDKLQQCKLHNYDLGQNIFNWEIEQKKFISSVNFSLSSF